MREVQEESTGFYKLEQKESTDKTKKNHEKIRGKVKYHHGKNYKERSINRLNVVERINRNITGNTNGFKVSKELDALGKSNF